MICGCIVREMDGLTRPQTYMHLRHCTLPHHGTSAATLTTLYQHWVVPWELHCGMRTISSYIDDPVPTQSSTWADRATRLERNNNSYSNDPVPTLGGTLSTVTGLELEVQLL